MCQTLAHLILVYETCLVAELGTYKVAVEASYMCQADLLGTFGCASTGVGAVTEAEFVHLLQHSLGTLVFLSFALRQQIELADFGSHEEHRTTVLASRSTSTATDT